MITFGQFGKVLENLNGMCFFNEHNYRMCVDAYHSDFDTCLSFEKYVFKMRKELVCN